MIEPSFQETLLPEQVKARLQQLRATFIPEKSVQGRMVYWVRPKNTWILVTPKGNAMTVGYYRMERCPCDS